MLYSEKNDRLVIAVDKGSLSSSIDDFLESLSSTVKSHQQAKYFDKKEVKFDALVDEISGSRPINGRPNGVVYQDYETTDLVRDETYYFDMATFLVQDTIFLLPKHELLQKTDSFSVLFEAENGTPENPVRFNDVLASDFRGLMKYLYPLNNHESLTNSDWISTLKLSTKWRMLDIRAEAIQNLDGLLSPIAKVQLGNSCKVADWARSGYADLIQRHDHFTEEEVKTIGLHTTVKLCELREQVYSLHWDTYLNRLTLDVHGTSNLVSQLFLGGELLDDGDEDLVDAFIKAQSQCNPILVLNTCNKLMKRMSSLSEDEVGKLGVPNTVKFWQARLETRRAAWSLVQEARAGINGDLWEIRAEERVSSAFGEELERTEVEEVDYVVRRRGKGKAALGVPVQASGGIEASDQEEHQYKGPSKSPNILPATGTAEEPAGEPASGLVGATTKPATKWGAPSQKASTWGAATKLASSPWGATIQVQPKSTPSPWGAMLGKGSEDSSPPSPWGAKATSTAQWGTKGTFQWNKDPKNIDTDALAANGGNGSSLSWGSSSIVGRKKK